MFENVSVQAGSRIAGRYKTPGKPGLDLVFDAEAVVSANGRAYLVGTPVEGMPWADGWMALRADRFLPTGALSVEENEGSKELPTNLLMYPQLVSSFSQVEEVDDPIDLAAGIALGGVFVKDIAVEEIFLRRLVSGEDTKTKA